MILHQPLSRQCFTDCSSVGDTALFIKFGGKWHYIFHRAWMWFGHSTGTWRTLKLPFLTNYVEKSTEGKRNSCNIFLANRKRKRTWKANVHFHKYIEYFLHPYKSKTITRQLFFALKGFEERKGRLHSGWSARYWVRAQRMRNHAQGIAAEAKLLVRKGDWTGQQTRMCSCALVPTIWGMWAKTVTGLHPGDYTRDVSSSGSQRRLKIILIRVLAMLLTFSYNFKDKTFSSPLLPIASTN